MDDLPSSFGKYYLTEKLATGGMAEIYLGKILGPGGFEKQLVIKQIHPRLSGQRQFVDMFVAEAKTLVTLAHGNIVPVYELGVVDDIYFIAMEYIDGPTLYRFTEASARRGYHLPSAVGAWIAAEILEGLDYAHRKGEGVIHRDLSPRNVMLSRDGEVKLVDFGIAVAFGATGDKDGSAPTGSFPYMSPEQVRREPLDGQSDLFSVGVLLWEMLTGQRLFARSNSDATLQAVLEADILLPSSIRPSVPARLDDVVARALARDRSQRWESAADFLAALNKHLYSLEKTPGARDLAPIVAKLCPPELRRASTEAGREEPSAPFAMPTAEEPNSPPSTAVMARDGGTQRKVMTFAKQKSFATHVQWKQVLERATPLLGTPALTEEQVAAVEAAGADGGDTPVAVIAATAAGATDSDSAPGPTTKVAPRPARASDPAIGKPAVAKPVAKPEAASEAREPVPVVDAVTPASTTRRLVIGGALVAAAILGVTVRFACSPPSTASAIDAAVAPVPPDAPPRPVDAAPLVAGVDAPPGGIDAAPATVDAAIASARPDAPPRRDARSKPDATPSAPGPDARPKVKPDAPAAATAFGTLLVSATPWGKVSLDGKPLPDAPNTYERIPVGKHDLVVEYPESQPPQREARRITIKENEVTKETFRFTP
jgi:eukaryotic-like serine/threonine-protein kinase